MTTSNCPSPTPLCLFHCHSALPQWSPGHRFPTIKCWHNKINSKTATKRFSQIGGKCKQTETIRMKKSTMRPSRTKSTIECCLLRSTMLSSQSPTPPLIPLPAYAPACWQWRKRGNIRCFLFTCPFCCSIWNGAITITFRPECNMSGIYVCVVVLAFPPVLLPTPNIRVRRSLPLCVCVPPIAIWMPSNGPYSSPTFNAFPKLPPAQPT